MNVAHVLGHHEAAVTKVEYFLVDDEVFFESTLFFIKEPVNVCLVTKLINITGENDHLDWDSRQVVEWRSGLVVSFEVSFGAIVISLELLSFDDLTIMD